MNALWRIMALWRPQAGWLAAGVVFSLAALLAALLLMTQAGFELLPGSHPITAVDAAGMIASEALRFWTRTRFGLSREYST
jgi:hypothetical protein